MLGRDKTLMLRLCDLFRRGMESGASACVWQLVGVQASRGACSILFSSPALLLVPPLGCWSLQLRLMYHLTCLPDDVIYVWLTVVEDNVTHVAIAEKTHTLFHCSTSSTSVSASPFLCVSSFFGISYSAAFCGFSLVRFAIDLLLCLQSPWPFIFVRVLIFVYDILRVLSPMSPSLGYTAECACSR